MQADSTVSLLRLLMWVAAIAFLTGFAGAMAVGLTVSGTAG